MFVNKILHFCSAAEVREYGCIGNLPLSMAANMRALTVKNLAFLLGSRQKGLLLHNDCKQIFVFYLGSRYGVVYMHNNFTFKPGSKHESI